MPATRALPPTTALRGALALAAAVVLVPARASEASDIEQVRASTVQLIGMLVEQGVLRLPPTPSRPAPCAYPTSPPSCESR